MSRLSVWLCINAGFIIAELFEPQFDVKEIFTAMWASGWALALHWFWNSQYHFFSKGNAS